MTPRPTTTAEAARRLRAMAKQVGEAMEGSRNDVLNRTAFQQREPLKAGLLTQANVVMTLTAAARHCGLDDAEIQATLRSALGSELSDSPPVPAQPIPPVSTHENPPTTPATNNVGGCPGVVMAPAPVVFTHWRLRDEPKDGTETEYTFEGLCYVIENPIDLATDGDEQKDNLPLWSPSVYRHRYRNKKNVIRTDVLMLDVDEGNLHATAILARFGDMNILIHSTFSHSPGNAKWRILVFLSRPVKPEEYPQLWRWGQHFVGVVDPKAKDASRGFYMPCRRPGHDYRGIVHPGSQVLDVDAALQQQAEREKVADAADHLVSLGGLESGDWLCDEPAPRQALLHYADSGQPFLLDGKTAMLAAAGATSKTMLVCILAMCVATGRKWLGKFTVERPGYVLIALGEEDKDEVKRRLQWISRSLRLTIEEREAAMERIHVLPGCGLSLRLQGGGASRTPFYHSLVGKVGTLEDDLRLLVLDPSSRFMGPGAEIDAAEATAYVETLETLTQLKGCPAVIACHHISKSALKAGEQNQAAARGSSALVDGVRWLGLIDKPKPRDRQGAEEMSRVGIEPGRLLRMDVVKSNYTAPQRHPLFLRIGAGGLVEPLTDEQEQAVEQALKGGGGGEREGKGRKKKSEPDGLFEGIS